MTSEPSTIKAGTFGPTSLSGGHPVKRQQNQPLFMASEPERVSGQKCAKSSDSVIPPGLSWSSRPEMRRGKPKSLKIFKLELDHRQGTASADLSSVLRMLVHLIYGGACSWLPAPACRDWRSPGKRSHPRLSASRGQQMPEVI